MLSRAFVIRAIGLAAAALGLSAGVARACMCVGDGGLPACHAYNQADAVFFGNVRYVDIRKAPVKDASGVAHVVDRKFAHIEIEHAVLGVTERAVDIFADGSDCEYQFQPGQRYVIFAYRDKTDGSLLAPNCAGTRPVGKSSKDLAYFSAPGPGARVFGTIKHLERNPASDRAKDYGGVPDVRVFVRGAAGVFSAVTDAKGRYAIDGMPPGTYETEVQPPAALSAWYVMPRKFELKSAHACQVLDPLLRYAGRVAGTVLDAAGRPAPDVRVEIATTRSPDKPISLQNSSLVTDANGHFELADVAPGSYVVGVGVAPQRSATRVYARTMFPGTIEVGKGNRVDIGVLRLPEPARQYELRGVVVDAGGAPAAGASVYVTVGDGLPSTPLRTGPDGSFTLPVFDGQSYSVRAVLDVPVTRPPRRLSAATTLTIQGEPPPIRLVVR